MRHLEPKPPDKSLSLCAQQGKQQQESRPGPGGTFKSITPMTVITRDLLKDHKDQLI